MLASIEKLGSNKRFAERRNIHSSSDLGLCPLCEEAPESADHLFLLCDNAWKVWTYCISWWDMSWVWAMILYAVIWSIWKARNEVVFWNKRCHWKEIVESKCPTGYMA